MNRFLSFASAGALGLTLLGGAALPTASIHAAPLAANDDSIQKAFGDQSIQLTSSDIERIRNDIALATEARCIYGPTGDNSKAKFAAVEIAAKLDLNTKTDASVMNRINAALKTLPCFVSRCGQPEVSRRCRPIEEDLSWQQYFNETLSLNNNREFLSLVNEKGFSPVKISWEDIGRYENSVWGDRISDVGIWVRRNEFDAATAELALSVRRDSNFRDKVLVVPSEKIKVHIKDGRETREVTLAERLKQLELDSPDRDRNVIVSNQFAIVPVPSRSMNVPAKNGEPPRAAFNFSIFPYGSTNFVITDVIEGSSEAIVGPGSHQMLFANINGKKAPFTASRAEERQDLLKLESELKAKGMDVDVQRYYLIQIPLEKGAAGIELSNMGTPPLRYQPFAPGFGIGVEYESMADMAAPSAASAGTLLEKKRGLDKVAIGHGEIEGEYSRGSGFQGKRANEPVRVTVVYFVTPVGKVTRDDMESFSEAFKKWDESALWGGSFVVKES